MAHLVALNVLHVNLKQYSRKQQPLGRYLRNHRNKASLFAISLVLGNNVDKNRNKHRRPMGYGSSCSFQRITRESVAIFPKTAVPGEIYKESSEKSHFLYDFVGSM